MLIPVFYDKFIESDNYRQSIAEQASLKKATHFSLDLVDTRYGNGSSFNPGQTVSADVNALKSRWRDLDKGRGIWDEWMSRYVEIARLGTNPFWIEQKDSEPYKCIHGNCSVKVYLKNIWVACLLNLRMADSISRLRSWFGLRKSIY